MEEEAIIPRPRYLERIRPFADTALIKLITGQRRVGKSSILRLLAQQSRTERPERPVLYIDKELSRWDSIKDGASLEAEAKALPGSGKVALFIDEAQEIPGFDRALRSLAAEGRHDIYVTGTNAQLLSGEIATFFTGRVATLRIHPLSYDEFLVFHGHSDSDEALNLYLRYGGLPFLRNLSLQDETVFEYLGGVFDSVVLKDIVLRHGVRNPAILSRIAEFVADSIGSPSSARNIANYLKSGKIEVSPQSVLDYLAYLEQSFAVRRIQPEDLQGKRILESGNKYYFEDLGLRSKLRGFAGRDIAKVVENAVFLRLELDGWEIHSGRSGSREIDFVCDRAGQRIHVQACYLLADETTREREFGALLELDDAWPKFVVSMDPIQADERGVRHLSLRSFLLGEYEKLA
ncbi:MAG: ATP-binding protein [Spirochaetota bacterium]